MKRSNNHIHSDSKKRRFAMLFTAGDVKRYAKKMKNVICKNCGAPDKELWPVATQHYLKTIHLGTRGHYYALKECITCGVFWFLVSYEPYDSFPYHVIWPYSELEWNKNDNEDSYLKLLEWHQFMVWRHSAPNEPQGCVKRPPQGISEGQILGK